MARIVETVTINCNADTAWGAVGDIGGLERSVPQLVTRCAYDEATATRTVTFVNGQTLVEPIVARDDDSMTLVWTAQGGEWHHHNASMHVSANDDGTSNVCWTADVLPNDQGPTITGIIQAGLAALKETLEKGN
ncbi:SRPBCC family protein [Parerythrobacter jejuensis]|uniref:SRPBCC family protein n=1 Tax=Parerythrobacter jejuensis TaxID=795812 RepID=A0A845AU69_9SPHN|nr:SRPBCC family protein [Parerythrobacter jejuensis]MXP32857.1 SRPBCC family protein [Parerythrobacter jejuensis]